MIQIHNFIFRFKLLLFQASTSTQASPTPPAVLSQVLVKLSDNFVTVYWSYCDHDFSHDRHQRKEEVTLEAGKSKLEGEKRLWLLKSFSED